MVMMTRCTTAIDLAQRRHICPEARTLGERGLEPRRERNQLASSEPAIRQRVRSASIGAELIESLHLCYPSTTTVGRGGNPGPTSHSFGVQQPVVHASTQRAVSVPRPTWSVFVFSGT
jgi:hypothetical protein